MLFFFFFDAAALLEDVDLEADAFPVADFEALADDLLDDDAVLRRLVDDVYRRECRTGRFQSTA